MRLGIGSYAFAWAIGVTGAPPVQPLSPFDLLEAARAMGVRLVQFCDNLPLTALSPVELDRLEREVRRDGMRVELGTRGLNHDGLLEHVRLCQRLGSSILRLVVDQPGDEPSPAEIVRRLEQVRKPFAMAGVRLAIENHDRLPSRELAGVVRQLGRDYAGICLDTVNSFGALEGPERVVEQLGELTLCVHVKDFTIRRFPHGMGFVIEGCPAGQGRLDVPWLLHSLEQGGSQGNSILETWVSPSDSLEETIARERSWAEAGVRYLRQWIVE